jgi:hypothetical protein
VSRGAVHFREARTASRPARGLSASGSVAPIFSSELAGVRRVSTVAVELACSGRESARCDVLTKASSEDSLYLSALCDAGWDEWHA